MTLLCAAFPLKTRSITYRITSSAVLHVTVRGQSGSSSSDAGRLKLDSSVGYVTGYLLDGRRSMLVVFMNLPCYNPNMYQSRQDSYSWVKLPELKAEHPYGNSSDFKKIVKYTVSEKDCTLFFIFFF